MSADRVPVGADDGVLGLDRNLGQATDSEGTVYAMASTVRLDVRIVRKQRELSRKQGWGPQDRRPRSNRGRHLNGQLRKLHRKRRRQRDDSTHQASRRLAEAAHTVVVEDLPVKAMTASAKGSVAEPGRNVRQKAGLNRAILQSNWSQLERKLAYKVGALVKVDPAYTSQTCAVCGHVHRDNRPSQGVFLCGACGFCAHADHNAAINILVRAGLPSRARSARGAGASARRGAFPPGTPLTREPDRQGYARPVRSGPDGPDRLSNINLYDESVPPIGRSGAQAGGARRCQLGELGYGPGCTDE